LISIKLCLFYNKLKACKLVNNFDYYYVALPLCPELHRTIFPRNEDIGSFLRVNGTVVRTVLPKLLEYKRVYYCSKCKELFDVKV